MSITWSKITIITPCYNEHVIVIKFLAALEQMLATLPYTFEIVVVNDCSNDNTLSLLKNFHFNSSNISLTIINLQYNVGHQAAIYQGFIYAQTSASNHFIVMDSDGEDAPGAIPLLLAHVDTDIVNVVRSHRRESLFFKFCYQIYKILFRLITGKRMNFGNFCLISRRVMEQAIFTGFPHFASFLSKQKCATKYIISPKEERLGGQSKMGYKKLFYHAIKSFMEYGTDIFLLFFKGFIVCMLLLLCCIGDVLYHKFITHTSIQQWMGITIIGLINLCVLCGGFFAIGLLLIHLYKQNTHFKTPIYELCSDGDTKETI